MEPARIAESRSEAAIVTTALARASTNLDLPNHILAAVVGLPEPTISHLRCGTYILQRNEKAFELALLLVRLYQSLSRIAQLDQRTALPDQCLHSAEADVWPPRRKSGFDRCYRKSRKSRSSENLAKVRF
jgi:hypothetical protein